MMKVPVLLFCLGTMILFSCKKTTPSLVTETDFPLSVNANWTYKLTDSSTMPAHIDTITLKIMSSEKIVDSQIWHCNLYKDGLLINTGDYIQYGNRIYYKGNSGNSNFGEFVLQFPMSTSSVWPGLYTADTVKVVNAKSSLVVLGNQYNDVDVITRQLFAIDFSINQTLYFAKGLGIIKQEFQQYTLVGPTRTTYELINYSLH